MSPVNGRTEAKTRSRRAPVSPGDVIGAEGRPIREYRGWDEAAGVFRIDDPAALPELLQQVPARAGGAAAPDEGVPTPPEVAALFGLPADAASAPADAAGARAGRNRVGRRGGRGAD